MSSESEENAFAPSVEDVSVFFSRSFESPANPMGDKEPLDPKQLDVFHPFPYPKTENILDTHARDGGTLIKSNPKVLVSEKLDGCPITVATGRHVFSRYRLIMSAPSIRELRRTHYAGTSMRSLYKHLENVDDIPRKLTESLEKPFKDIAWHVFVYGEFLGDDAVGGGFATDFYQYVQRGYIPGEFVAYAMTLYPGEPGKEMNRRARAALDSIGMQPQRILPPSSSCKDVGFGFFFPLSDPVHELLSSCGFKTPYYMEHNLSDAISMALPWILEGSIEGVILNKVGTGYNFKLKSVCHKKNQMPERKLPKCPAPDSSGNYPGEWTAETVGAASNLERVNDKVRGTGKITALTCKDSLLAQYMHIRSIMPSLLTLTILDIENFREYVAEYAKKLGTVLIKTYYANDTEDEKEELRQYVIKKLDQDPTINAIISLRTKQIEKAKRGNLNKGTLEKAGGDGKGGANEEGESSKGTLEGGVSTNCKIDERREPKEVKKATKRTAAE